MSKNDQDRGVAVNLRFIPRDVHRRFKAWCAARGTSMTDVLVQYMDGVTKEVRANRKENHGHHRPTKE